MTATDEKLSPSIKSLTRHPDIRAVVLMDRKGNIAEQFGDAHALIPGPDDPTVILPVNSDDDPEEALYVCKYDDDFLLVVFEESADFDVLKNDVDSALESDDE